MKTKTDQSHTIFRNSGNESHFLSFEFNSLVNSKLDGNFLFGKGTEQLFFLSTDLQIKRFKASGRDVPDPLFYRIPDITGYQILPDTG